MREQSKRRSRTNQELTRAPGRFVNRSRRELGQDARPATGALAERAEVVLLVGRVDAVVVEPEADEQAVHAQRLLEGGDDRDRAAHADQRGWPAPLLLQRLGRTRDVGRFRVEGDGLGAASAGELDA